VPRGPRGEKKPADVVGCSVAIARLSVGDAGDNLARPSGRVRIGHVEAKARATKFSSGERREIARKADPYPWAGHGK
jgi:hypothetical protein